VGNLRRRFGFWGVLGRMRLADLKSPEIIVGVLLGVGLALLLNHLDSLSAIVGVAGDYLVISGALLGIVFAGFALVIGLLSDQYLRWLEQTESGILGFLSPFMISVGLQVGALVSAILYRALAAHVPREARDWAFGIVSVLFFVAVLDVVALARSVLMHGVARAEGLKITDFEEARGRDRKSG
jgi:MFS family permease